MPKVNQPTNKLGWNLRNMVGKHISYVIFADFYETFGLVELSAVPYVTQGVGWVGLALDCVVRRLRYYHSIKFRTQLLPNQSWYIANMPIIIFNQKNRNPTPINPPIANRRQTRSTKKMSLRHRRYHFNPKISLNKQQSNQPTSQIN